jgi:uncharacterized protein with PIN domain
VTSAAKTAYLKYGNGQNSAHLNIGDYRFYSGTKIEGLPLLSKGMIFAKLMLSVLFRK